VESDEEHDQQGYEGGDDAKLGGVVAEQAKGKTGTAKKLGDLFSGDSAPKTKPAQPKKPKEEKQKPIESGGDVKRPLFSNSKGVINKEAGSIPTQTQPKTTGAKLVTGGDFTNKKPAGSNTYKTAEENAKIKPTKSYLESDLAKPHVEDKIEKVDYKNTHIKDQQGEHFVDVDKSQDLFYKKISSKRCRFHKRIFYP